MAYPQMDLLGLMDTREFDGSHQPYADRAMSADTQLSSETYKLKSAPLRRGPFRTEQHRQQTAQTRKLVACLRCRMQRIRVRYNP